VEVVVDAASWSREPKEWNGPNGARGEGLVRDTAVAVTMAGGGRQSRGGRHSGGRGVVVKRVRRVWLVVRRWQGLGCLVDGSGGRGTRWGGGEEMREGGGGGGGGGG
jgi:hypothetical protein